jgi:hypothetical protein
MCAPTDLLLGKVVAAQFPHLRECRVIEVSSSKASLALGPGGTVVRMNHNMEQAVQWVDNARTLQRTLLTGGGQLRQAAIQGAVRRGVCVCVRGGGG